MSYVVSEKSIHMRTGLLLSEDQLSMNQELINVKPWRVVVQKITGNLLLDATRNRPSSCCYPYSPKMEADSWATPTIIQVIVGAPRLVGEFAYPGSGSVLEVLPSTTSPYAVKLHVAHSSLGFT